MGKKFPGKLKRMKKLQYIGAKPIWSMTRSRPQTYWSRFHTRVTGQFISGESFEWCFAVYIGSRGKVRVQFRIKVKVG